MVRCPHVSCKRKSNLEEMAKSKSPNVRGTAMAYIDTKCDLNYKECCQYQDSQRKVSNPYSLLIE